MGFVYIELKISGNKKCLYKFYNENNINNDDVEINPTLYKKISKLSFEKLISSSIINTLYETYVKNQNHKYQIKNVKNNDDLYRFLYGSSSDAYNIDVELTDTQLFYSFNTKKSAPIIWINGIAEKYSALKFEFYISYEDKQEMVYKMTFENGKMIENKEVNAVEEFYQKYENGRNEVFDKMIDYMKSKKIDYKKYINRIYETHSKECDNDISQIDYDGVLEEFIEKVKLGKFVNKLFEENDSLLYFYSKEFVFYIKNKKEDLV